MPTEVSPDSLSSLAEALRECSAQKQIVELGGNFTKRSMGGEIAPPDVILSTRRLNRVITYEPKDLTISVEAGMSFRELEETLRANGQMLPLDPPFSSVATIGGVVAANSSGPRRRRYGTARDMIIGMTMITIDGTTFQSGGMVVKNVTGLDMAKLMAGSLGTLAAIGSVNFKVFPRPPAQGSFLCASDSLHAALNLRRAILTSVLEPIAIDLLNAEAARHIGDDLPASYVLALEVSGNQATVKRYEREYQRLANECGISMFLPLAGEDAEGFWSSVRDFTPAFASENPQMSVLRVSAEPKNLGEIFKTCANSAAPPPIVARAGAGVGYVYCSDAEQTQSALGKLRAAGLKTLVECAPAQQKRSLTLWDAPGADFEIMCRIKDALDPYHLLNPGRLFQRL